MLHASGTARRRTAAGGVGYQIRPSSRSSRHGYGGLRHAIFDRVLQRVLARCQYPADDVPVGDHADPLTVGVYHRELAALCGWRSTRFTSVSRSNSCGTSVWATSRTWGSLRCASPIYTSDGSVKAVQFRTAVRRGSTGNPFRWRSGDKSDVYSRAAYRTR